MQIRNIRREELEEALKLSAVTFNYVTDIKKDAEKYDSGQMPLDSIYGAFTPEGRMAGGLIVLPFDCWFDGSSVGCGGIASVVSRPEYRRSGNIRRLFEHVMQVMYDRGDVFSYLFPFSFAYYRQFGYEASSMVNIVTVPTAELCKLRRLGHAEEYTEDTDPGDIVDVYDAFASRHNMMIDRQGWRWMDLLERDPMTDHCRTYIWYDEENNPCAYARLQFPPSGNTQPIRVEDMAWLDDDAKYGLLGFLGCFNGNYPSVCFDCGPEMLPELTFPNYWDLEVKRQPSGMSRVVNARRALELMKKPGEGEAVIEVQDDFFPANSARLLLEWGHGQTHIKPTDAPAALTCSAAALSQLVTGFDSLELLSQRSDIRIDGDMDQLSRLFARKKVFITDHF